MLLYFTSGTVSYPKMVMHTQASYGIGHTITARYWQDLREGDVHWTVSDMGWAKAAWGKLFGQWQQGAAGRARNKGKPQAGPNPRPLTPNQTHTLLPPPNPAPTT